MLILLFFIAIGLIHIAFMFSDRGMLEHLSMGEIEYIEKLRNIPEKGIDVIDLKYNFQAVKLRVLPQYIFFVILLIGLYAVKWIFPVPAYILGGVLSVYCVFKPTWDRFLISNVMGKDARENLNIKQKCIRFTFSIISFIISALGFTLLIGGDPWIFYYFSESPIAAVAYTVIDLISIFTLLIFAGRIFDIGRKISMKCHTIEFGISTKANSILYLRSFSDDKIKVYYPFSDGCYHIQRLLWPKVLFENLVSSYAVHVGCTVVAIGKPGETLPQLGAIRTYVSDDTWQKEVKSSATRVKEIILIAGSSSGVAWEVEQIRKLEMLSKTLILIPPLSEQETVNRASRVLSDLELLNKEQKSLEVISSSIIIGIRGCNESGIEWLTNDGRKWSAYIIAQLYKSAIFERHGNSEKGEKNVNNISTRPKKTDKLQKKIAFKAIKAQIVSKKDPGKAADIYQRILESYGPSLRADCKLYLLFAFIGDNIETSRNKKTYDAALKAIELCEELDWVWLGALDFQPAKVVKVEMYNVLLSYCDNDNQFRQATFGYYDAAIELNDPEIVAHASYELAYIEINDRNYDNALTHMLGSQKIYKERGTLLEESFCLWGIGECWSKKGEHQKAIEFGKQSYKNLLLCGEYENATKLAGWCGNIASKINQKEDAKHWLKECAECAKQAGTTWDMKDLISNANSQIDELGCPSTFMKMR